MESFFPFRIAGIFTAEVMETPVPEIILGLHGAAPIGAGKIKQSSDNQGYYAHCVYFIYCDYFVYHIYWRQEQSIRKGWVQPCRMQ